MKLVVIGSVIFLFTFSAGAGTFLEDFDNNFGVWQELLVLDELPGSWKIVDGELHAVSPEGSTRLLTVGDETWRDYTIEFDVKPLDKQGPSNIVIAARINGSWVAWCLIGDLPSFNDNVSRVMFAAGNFQDPSTFVFSSYQTPSVFEIKQMVEAKVGR